MLLSLLWVLFGGFWMAVGWAIAVVIMAITSAGIPFAWTHLKVAGIALRPIGKIIVKLERDDDSKKSHPALVKP